MDRVHALQSGAMREDPAAAPCCEPAGPLVYRRGKLRTREDDEVRMMRAALAALDDRARVMQILLELGRFYNPVTDRPVMPADTRHLVMERLDSGDVTGARVALETHLAEYRAIDESLGARGAAASGGASEVGR